MKQWEIGVEKGKFEMARVELKRSDCEETQASLMAQIEKNLPAMGEMWARSLGWEDALENGVSTHVSVPAWRIPWTEEPGGLKSVG